MQKYQIWHKNIKTYNYKVQSAEWIANIRLTILDILKNDIINMTYSWHVYSAIIRQEVKGSMKIDRLIGILSVLLQEEKVTAPELAQKFEVSRRTINRDIEDLCKAGIPIRTTQGIGGGIRIMDGYRMDRTLLTSKDMQALLAGLRGLDSVSGSHYYRQLMEKVKTGSSSYISGNESILIDLSAWNKEVLASKIEMIQDAMEERKMLSFRYYAPSGDSIRDIEPYFLISNGVVGMYMDIVCFVKIFVCLN